MRSVVRHGKHKWRRRLARVTGAWLQSPKEPSPVRLQAVQAFERDLQLAFYTEPFRLAHSSMTAAALTSVTLPSHRPKPEHRRGYLRVVIRFASPHSARRDRHHSGQSDAVQGAPPHEFEFRILRTADLGRLQPRRIRAGAEGRYGVAVGCSGLASPGADSTPDISSADK